MNIIVYTKRGCGWCSEVVDFLQEKQINFEEREVLSNKGYFDEMVQKSGQTKSPTLDINGTILADSDRAAVEAFMHTQGVV